MKVLLLFNNYAANKRSVYEYDKIESLFRENKIEFDLKTTEHQHHGIEIIKNADLSKYDAVIGAGGDGTIFELLNGLMKNDKKIPLGVIPIGTGNAFARDLGLENHKWEDAINAIKNFKIKRIDIGHVEAHDVSFYFSNIVGFGFVTDVANFANHAKILGGASYTVGVLYHTIFLNSFNLQIEHDGKSYDKNTIFVEISNSRYTGKDFLMAPNAKMDDGLLDITILRKCSRSKVLTSLPTIFTGKHIYIDVIDSFQTREIKFTTSDHKKLAADGEIIGSTPITCKCIPDAVEVITNNVET